MTQFWRVEIHRYNCTDTTELFATVSDLTGSHRLRINDFSFSSSSLSLHFYPSEGELAFRNRSVFLGGLQLERIYGCSLTSPVDALVTAQLDIAIANIEETVLPTQYFRGVPVRAETRYLDFLVTTGRVELPNPNAADLNAEYLRFSCMNGGTGIVFPTPHQHPYPSKCKTCRNFHGKSYGGNFLVCGIHPYGNGEDCSDFEGQEP